MKTVKPAHRDQRELERCGRIEIRLDNRKDGEYIQLMGGILMKRCIIVIVAVLFCFLGVNMVFATPDTWTQKADFGGTARDSAVGFSVGSKGYIGTGYDDSRVKDFWEYDSVANTWTQKADFGGTGRYSATGFSIGSNGYIGTGYDGSPKKDFWKYDSVLNTWTQKADFGGTVRDSAVGFSIGNKGYIGTGYDGSSRYKDFWEYNPAINTWTQKADFGGTGRYYAAGFSIGNKGYIGTGYDGSYTKDFWEYDSVANVWTQKADFGGTARNGAVGFSIGNKGYIGTGRNGSSRYQDFWEYDSSLNTWTQKTGFGGTAREVAVGFSTGSKGYIGTGWDDLERKEFWQYEAASPFNDVATNYWAYDYIMTIYNKGYTTGYSAGIFAPELNVNREQMAAFIIRAKEGEPDSNYCLSGIPFPDCSADSWSCKYIKRLFELGLTTGYGTTGYFMPAYNVSREQMAAFLVRAIEGEPAANYCDSGSPFTDVTATDWACKYIKRLYELGITTGYGNGLYGPLDLVTRAQMAVFLGRAFLGME
jgi:hypothetical protein